MMAVLEFTSIPHSWEEMAQFALVVTSTTVLPFPLGILYFSPLRALVQYDSYFPQTSLSALTYMLAYISNVTRNLGLLKQLLVTF